MGILGHLFGKKKDDLGLDRHEPDIGMPSMTPTQGGGMTGFGDPLGSPDMGFGGPSPASPPGTGAPGEVSPEAFGFEKVTEKDMRSSAHDHALGEINFGKDLEIISAKLDAIKAELDSMNQRLKRMERLSEGTSNFPKDKWSY